MKEFERIRERGYACDNEEFNEGLRCLAVPIEGLRGRFALGISVPSGRFDSTPCCSRRPSSKDEGRRCLICCLWGNGHGVATIWAQ